MWGVVAAWVVCLASLSLPWPGVTLVVLLCCVAVFELASPTAWVAAAAARRTGGANKPPAATVPNLEEMTTDQGRKNGSNSSGAVAAPSSDAGVPPSRRTPSAALAGVVRFLTERLRLGGRDGGEMEEVGMTAAVGSGGGGVASGADGEGDATQQERQSKSRSQRSATFLKGSVGSFSRGGLMVTPEGRVIYKVNQDRGLISHPSLNRARHTIFGVFDGHGENGEHVAAYTMREVPRRLELHPESLRDPVSALEDVFLGINSSLPKSGINALFGGCTAVVALVRGPRVWVANAGDSRALVAGRGRDGIVVARGLTRDQNPDSPGERERIEAMGGFVSDPEEAGASARVWLDATRTLVGLAMARSIGDLAVKKVGVIALPEVTEYVLTPEDEFLVLASDGVWEFIDNQEASEVVQGFFDRGEDAAGACKGLMELANRRWSDMVGDYRDDITATVVRLPFLPPAAAAEALAMNASTDEEDASAAAAAAAVARIAAAEEEAAAAAAVAAAAVAAAAAETPTLPGAQEEANIGGITADAGAAGAEEAVPAITRAEGYLPEEETSEPAVGAFVDAVVDGASRSEGESIRDEGRGGVGVGGFLFGRGGGGGGSDSGKSEGGEGEIEGDGLKQEEGEGSGRSAAVAKEMAAAIRDLDHVDLAKAAAAAAAAAAATVAATREDVRDVGKDAREDERGVQGDCAAAAVEHKVSEDTAETANIHLTTIPETVAVKNSDDGEGHTGKEAPPSEAVASASLPAPAPGPAPSTAKAADPPVAEGAKGEILSMGEVEGEEGEIGPVDGEEWEWDFGAREHREPSREIREASREFPSGSLDALVAGVAAEVPASSSSSRRV